MKSKLILIGSILCLLIMPKLSSQSLANEVKNLKYIDAGIFTIINKAQKGGPEFARLDTIKYPELPPIVKQYYNYSTGLAITFRTNSKNIALKWNTEEEEPSLNTTFILQKGFDLYIKKDNKWVFAGVATPTVGTRHQSPIVENMDESVKTCLLYLPIFANINRLELGIDEGSVIEKVENKFRHKIVVIGSSITHGAAASRPGMAYPAQLNRHLGFEFPNLGACGQCKLDQYYAKIAADTEADAFLFDVFSNPSPKQINERLKNFVDIIQAKHPNTPLIFLQTEVRETGNFNLKARHYEFEKREAAERGIRDLKKAGYKNLYFINPGIEIGSDHESTVDGVHPTDLGFRIMLKHLEPQLVKILNKHGIK